MARWHRPRGFPSHDHLLLSPTVVWVFLLLVLIIKFGGWIFPYSKNADWIGRHAREIL